MEKRIAVLSVHTANGICQIPFFALKERELTPFTKGVLQDALGRAESISLCYLPEAEFVDDEL